MNSKIPVVPLVAVLSIGAASGFALGRARVAPDTVRVLSGPRTSAEHPTKAALVRAASLPPGLFLPPGSLVPVSFADLDRELSLLKTLDLALRSDRVSDLARATVVEDPRAVLSLAGGKLSAAELIRFQELYLARWAQLDVVAALAWARQQSSSTREALMVSVVQSWVKRDSQSALAFVAQITEGGLHRSLLMAAFGGWAETDPERAWVEVQKLGNSVDRPDLAQLVLLSWVRKDGPRAARLAMELNVSESNGVRTQEVLGTWLAQDPKAAVEWVRSLPGGVQKTQLIVALAGDLARGSPEDALDLARGLPVGVAREQSIRGVLAQWVYGDADAALRWARSSGDPTLLRLAQSAAVEYWATVDPRRAAAMFTHSSELAADAMRDGHLGQIGRQWARRNPAEAMEWARSLSRRQQLQAIPAILAGQAALDPNGAVTQAAALTDPHARRAATQMVLSEWAAHDSENAGKWLLGQPDRRLMAEMAPAILEQMAETDLAAATAFANQMPAGEVGSRAMVEMVGILANSSLTEAIAALEKIPVGTVKDGAMERLAWVWGQQDPAAAAKYALSQADTDGRLRLLDAAASEWATRDPAAGTAFWKEMGPGRGRDVFAENLARKWADSDPQAAIKWVTSLPPNERHPELLASVIGTWAQQSPAEAATYAGQLPAGLQEAAVRNVLTAYADQDPATGARWLAAFPDEALRNRLQVELVDRWAQQDAIAAGEWLRVQPAGPAQQAAIEAFTRTVSQREPAAAWEWAAAVDNEQSRFALQQQAMRQWLRVDPEAASRALNQMEWPESLKITLRPPP